MQFNSMMGSVVFGLMLCATLQAQEKTPLVPDNFVELALQQIESVHSLHVTYELTETLKRHIAGLTSDAPGSHEPRLITVKFLDERRWFESVPLSEQSRVGIRRFVYDSGGSLTCDLKRLPTGLRTSGVFFSEGRIDAVDRNDEYSVNGCGIALSDYGRATLEESWIYPYCVTNARRNGPAYRVASELETVDGKPCVVLERPGVDKIWVDSSIGWRWRKRERYYDKQRLDLSFHNRDFREVAPSIWLPFHCSLRMAVPPGHEPANEFFLEKESKVLSVRVNDLTGADFHVEIPVGVVVSNTESGKSHALGGSFNDSIESLAQVARGETRWRRRWIGYLTVGVVSLLVVFVGVRWWRQRA